MFVRSFVHSRHAKIYNRLTLNMIVPVCAPVDMDTDTDMGVVWY